ncbi:MAG: BRCT domain-containing protein [Promethearchaeota archaeon]
MADLSLIKFCISDDLDNISVETAKSKVIENGGIIREDITNDLWYYVTNKSNANNEQFNKAKDLGVIFLDEHQFLEMLE